MRTPTLTLLLCLAVSPSAFGQAATEPSPTPASKAIPRRTIAVTVTMVEAVPSKLPADISADQVLERVQKLEQSGGLLALFRVRLTAVENEPAFVRYTERVPAVTSSQNFGSSRSSSRIQDVGTIVECRAVVDGDTVVAALDVEQSRLVATKVDMDEGESKTSKPPWTIRSVSAQSNLRIPNGATVILGGKEARTAEGDHQRSLILVTAKILE